MRITYRNKNNRDYWEDRWNNVAIDAKMENPTVYPLKYAELTIQGDKGRIMEAGCGAGRILRYYKEAGHPITGIDFIAGVIHRLRETDPELDVQVGDITDLRFATASFKYVLAFGLYHNLENGLERALSETFRVLLPRGKLCASFRADNIQTRLVDKLAERREDHNSGERYFHKVNLSQGEIRRLLMAAGFIIEQIFPVENMPLLYKFGFFRARTHKHFNENLGRKEGYRLSPFGQMIQKFLVMVFPAQFCNVFVVIAQKPPIRD